MAKRTGPVISPEAEQKIESFAEDLGALLGRAQNKAEGWIRQRNEIVATLESIRDAASSLLSQLGNISAKAATTTNRAYRDTATTPPEEVVAKAKRAARTVSDEAKAKFAAARKKR
jgi:hypothetical protein